MFDVRAYPCRALLALIKLIASLIPNYDLNVLDMDDNHFYSFTELANFLSRTIEGVLGHVYDIEKSNSKTESSILNVSFLLKTISVAIARHLGLSLNIGRP